MPADRRDRQHRQQNRLTSTNPGRHPASTRQHSQRDDRQALTPLTPADPNQHTKPAGHDIPLTLLTLPAHATDERSHCTQGGLTAVRREPQLKLSDLLAELDMSRAAFYRMRARGQAPKCIKLPNGQLRFRRSDFDAWLSEHEEASAC
jgi:predicted DNA-binding transcriptional regulator AlpA